MPLPLSKGESNKKAADSKVGIGARIMFIMDLSKAEGGEEEEKYA